MHFHLNNLYALIHQQCSSITGRACSWRGDGGGGVLVSLGGGKA